MRIILDKCEIANIDALTAEQRKAIALRGPIFTIQCLSGMKSFSIDGLGPNYETVRCVALGMKVFFEDCTDTEVEFTDLVKEKYPQGS